MVRAKSWWSGMRRAIETAGVLLPAVALLALAVVLPGCGAFRSPGFSGQKGSTSAVTAPTDAPKESILEWGPKDAKVRVIAFFFISSQGEYPVLMKTLQDLVKQYPGKVYVKYADLRTPDGQALRAKTGQQGAGAGLIINGKTEFTVKTGQYSHSVAFDQEPGGYWTEEDLKAVVAQEVAKVSGK